jgi:arylsulfatase A-like enzyme
MAAPNIVVILTDDQEDTGSMAYLPNVQALAAQGVTFKNSFVNFSLCSPSRSSFFTGEAAHNDGIKSNKPNKGGGWETFKQEEANDLPVWLKTAGYRTALIGKYENGYGAGKPPRLASAAYWANALNGWFGIGTPDKQHWVPQGWDVWYAFTKVRYYDYTINDNGKLLDFGRRHRLFDRRAEGSGRALHQGSSGLGCALLHADRDQGSARARRGRAKGTGDTVACLCQCFRRYQAPQNARLR